MAIAICWLTGLIGFLPSLGWNSGLFDNKCDFRVVMDFDYIIFSCIVASFLPTVIVIVVYIVIYKEISDQVRLWQSDLTTLLKHIFCFSQNFVPQWLDVIRTSQLLIRKKRPQRLYRWLSEVSSYVGFPWRWAFLCSPSKEIEHSPKRSWMFSSFWHTSTLHSIHLFTLIELKMYEKFWKACANVIEEKWLRFNPDNCSNNMISGTWRYPSWNLK